MPEGNADSGKVLSRRQMINGLGSELAAVVVSPGFGQEPIGQGANKACPSTAQYVQDPTSKYPKPPYNFVKQPWPGLANEMVPPPNHGEKSYKGSGRLLGRKALITGGDSGMGRAAAIAYARDGADVAINYYPSEEPDAKDVIAFIQAAGRKAVAISGDHHPGFDLPNL